MAIPNNYIDKITKDGDSRPICPPAEHVRVENDNFEGESLDDVLDEISESIGEAGKGSVNAVMVGSTPYTPDGDGVVDLSTPFGGKVDKVTGKGLSTNDYTDADKAAVDTIGSKANSADVYDKQTVDGMVANAGKVQTVSVNGGTPVQPVNGNVDLGAVVKSVTINGSTPSVGSDGNVNLGNVQGQKGDKGDTGDTLLVDGNFDPVTDIVNDLQTSAANKALSAGMGVRLKSLIDAYESRIDALEESGAALISVEGTTLVISRMNEPVVIVGDMTKDALTAVAGGESITSDFFVSGRNLEGNIGIALSDATNFSVVPTTLVPTDDKVQTTMVSVKFNPAAGLAAGSTHSCTVTVTYGGVAKKTMTIVGTVAASPSVSLSPASLTLNAAQGAQASGTITLQGVALSGDVTLALTGTGLSFDDDATTTTKTVTRADAENGTAITIYYTAGASDVNGSITATSGTATASATVNGVVSVPLAVDSYFDVPNATGGGKMRYTVLDATSVSVKAISTAQYWPSQLTIPATVNDAASNVEAVYDSSGNAISASGLTYNVTTIADEGFKNQVWFRDLQTFIISEGITTIGTSAFQGAQSIRTLSIPSSVTTIGKIAFNNTRIESLTLPAASCGSRAFAANTALRTVTFNGTINAGVAGFEGDTAIETVNINSCDQSLANWSTSTFNSCTQFTDGASLPEVHIDSVTPPALAANASTFPKDSNGKIQAKLYVPVGSEAAYRAANVWGNFVYINDSTN